MTLPTEVNLLLAGNQGGYQISRSVRLRSSASAYFNRTFSSVGNRQKWTWSSWHKVGDASSGSILFQEYIDGSNQSQVRFGGSTGQSRFYDLQGAAFISDITWTPVYRDPSAWYHVVFSVDTTQATNTNRVKFYVNGVQITATASATWPPQNSNLRFNGNTAHFMNQNGAGSGFGDSYRTEINFVNNQQLDPTSFGEFNSSTGVWQPKKYAGTYGTNGFYLNFSDNSAATAAAIGKDSSGNGNNWTPNNISLTAGATYDSMIDTPTPYADGGNGRGNYCNLNSLDKTTATTTANGNLSLTLPANVAGGCGSTFAVSSGKWYCEVTPTSGSNLAIGIVLASLTQNGANSLFATGYAYYQFNGNKYINGVVTAYGAAYVANDVIGIAIDFTVPSITFYKNNVSQGVITIAAGSYKLTSSNGSSTVAQICTWNFGQRPFTYTPPTGFLALNTQNLPASTITNGATQFAATLYTGNGATQSINNAVNGVSFQPDFVWMKSRSAATNHALYDVVRGTTKQLILTTAAETTEATGLTAFTPTGFTVGALAALNTNAATYVGWQWKTGGTAVTNTAGSTTTQVSANVSAGFSAFTYTGNGVAGSTIGHGLGAVPDMFVVKSLGVNNWPIYHSGNATPARDIFYLNLTNAVAVNTTFWNNVLPTSSVITLGNTGATNASAVNFIAYCWAAVAGYSAFGKYTGNASADGPFVYTGFRPRFILVRCATAVTNWVIWDTSRNTSNVVGEELYPNLSNAGGVGTDVDILANGFKIRGTGAPYNTSAGTMVYAAFAENPFKYALAR